MKRFDQINVIPFIDIMLVLLAIVLTTATFIVQGSIPIDLPRAHSGSPVSEQKAFIITIDQAGIFHHKEHTVSAIQLNALLAELHDSRQIQLRIDAGTRFEAFVTVMDALKRHSLERVSIITKKE